MDAVVLKNGRWEARVQPDYGMNLFCVRCDGRDLLRPCEGRETIETRHFLYGFPLIMPANRTAGGKFTYRGKEYTLPVNEVERGNNLHGMMVDAPFTVTGQTDTRVVARYENRGERYPFAFDMTVEVEVLEDGVQHTVRIRAVEDMPYTFGLHATFARPEKFYVPRGRQCVWDHNLVPTGQWIDPPLPLPESFDVCFAIPEKMECADQKVTGCYAMSGRTVLLDDTVFSVSDTYDHWVMFNGDGQQDFLCVEPQSGQVNGLNIPGGCRELAAGEEDVFRFTLSKK